MSVILFNKDEVYQKMADAYEEMKYVFTFGEDQEAKARKFYSNLRKLYYCNVATYMYQYNTEVGRVDGNFEPFVGLEGKPDMSKKLYESLSNFLDAWSSLQYNLVANDGTHFMAKDVEEFIQGLIEVFSTELCSRIKNK